MTPILLVVLGLLAVVVGGVVAFVGLALGAASLSLAARLHAAQHLVVHPQTSSAPALPGVVQQPIVVHRSEDGSFSISIPAVVEGPAPSEMPMAHALTDAEQVSLMLAEPADA